MVVLAKTHVACKNADGDFTLNRFVMKFVAQGSCPFDVIVVDEASQVDVARVRRACKQMMLKFERSSVL